jgi:ATP-dependent RNA helicase RhlE
MTFETLGLAQPIYKAILSKGYETPSPIQAAAIPAVLTGQDVMASAQTGTGKTAAFTLPILQLLVDAGGETTSKRKTPKVLVITPTRELAAQVHESIETYGRHLPFRSTVVFGGVKIGPQIRKLAHGVDILVATPGRLLDLCNQKAVQLTEVTTLVLDEADRMLDMGFIHDIRRVLQQTPKQKQTLLFSATFSADIRALARTLMHDPVEIDATPKNQAAPTVTQLVHQVDKRNKAALLCHLIDKQGWSQVLVFTKTKHGANKLVKDLYKSGINAAAIHGNKSQAQRTKALADFKQGKVDILVATDIAARGIDIIQLPQVVNFDLPHVPEDYVHRIGRTGRAGSEGRAISLVCADEIKQLHDIERLIRRNIEREEVEGFEVDHQLPAPRAMGAADVEERKPNNSSRRNPGRNRSNVENLDKARRRPPRRNPEDGNRVVANAPVDGNRQSRNQTGGQVRSHGGSQSGNQNRTSSDNQNTNRGQSRGQGGSQNGNQGNRPPRSYKAS